MRRNDGVYPIMDLRRDKPCPYIWEMHAPCPDSGQGACISLRIPGHVCSRVKWCCDYFLFRGAQYMSYTNEIIAT